MSPLSPPDLLQPSHLACWGPSKLCLPVQQRLLCAWRGSSWRWGRLQDRGHGVCHGMASEGSPAHSHQVKMSKNLKRKHFCLGFCEQSSDMIHRKECCISSTINRVLQIKSTQSFSTWRPLYLTSLYIANGSAGVRETREKLKKNTLGSFVLGWY